MKLRVVTFIFYVLIHHLLDWKSIRNGRQLSAQVMYLLHLGPLHLLKHFDDEEFEFL